MVLMIDNYDSFTYNLVQYLRELGAWVDVVRNDDEDLDALVARAPKAVVVSPGPCTPKEAGVSVEAIRHFAGRVPLLGVCLGHQSLAVAFGGEVVRADAVVHGKASAITHDADGLFAGLSSPVDVGRYHSLIVKGESLPACFEVTARTDAGEIMAMRHREHAVTWGVQFHPESILTPRGKDMLSNFLRAAA